MSAIARKLPPEVLDRLGKLMLMLSSPNDSERVAATEAIGRLLKSPDRDWHDLAGMLNASETPAAPWPAFRPSSSWRRTTGPVNLEREQLVDLLDLIEERCEFLPVKSAEFVSSLRIQARLWSVVQLSERQWKWLI
jgi:hypothetical protein